MNDRTQWFAQCGWGVFCHYLTTVETSAHVWNQRVDAFDVDGLARQLAEVGASYFFITVGQGSGHYCAPNATYDALVGIQPSKCSRRDLISDLYTALQPYGIQLLVYAPADGSNADLEARKGLGMTRHWHDDPGFDWGPGPHWGAYRLPEFQRNWEAVCRDWAVRWGAKVRGWWIDGAYAPELRYPEGEAPNYRTLAAVLRAGNPEAIVAFNTGVRVPVISVTPHEDFTAGELTGDLPVGGFGFSDNPAWCHVGPIQPFVNQARFHVLNFLGNWWGAGQPRFPDELVVGYTKYVVQHGGVTTWDVPIQENGRIPEAYMAQLRCLARAIPSSERS